MSQSDGARALARALFLSFAIHVLVIASLPAAPADRVGPLSLAMRLDARLNLRESSAAAGVPETASLVIEAPAVDPVPDDDANPPVALQPADVMPRFGANAVDPAAAGQSRLAAARSAGRIVPDELLTLRPRPIRLVDLDTSELRKIPAAGRIVLDLTVRRNGRVSNVLVVFCDLPGPYLAHTMKTFTEATYVPGEVLGDAVDSMLRVEISVVDGVPNIVDRSPGLSPAAGPATPQQPGQ